MKSKSILSHTIVGGIETYILKLKDSPMRAGIVIREEGKKMYLQEIRLEKIRGENNKIAVRLIKGL